MAISEDHHLMLMDIYMRKYSVPCSKVCVMQVELLKQLKCVCGVCMRLTKILFSYAPQH